MVSLILTLLMVEYNCENKGTVLRLEMFCMCRARSEMVNPWNDTLLSAMFSNYDLKDIYNGDEFGLSSLCPPDRSYHLKNEK